MTDKERLRQNQAQQGLQNQWPPKQGVVDVNRGLQNYHVNQRAQQPYHPSQLQQPPGYSPLSEADVQRIAEAVVARLKTDWLQR